MKQETNIRGLSQMLFSLSKFENVVNSEGVRIGDNLNSLNIDVSDFEENANS